MNQNMNKIIIVHPSDIILHGLSNILSETFSDEIILLKHPDELTDYPHLSGLLIIIIYEDYVNLFKHIIDNSLATCTLKFIEFKQANNIKNSNTIIHLRENKSSVIDKVNQCITSFKSVKHDKGNNELSPREIDVLKLLTKGYANKEIADKLFISTHTVISHRKNISEKTGIRSASGLTMFAVLKKIIDIDEISTSDLI